MESFLHRGFSTVTFFSVISAPKKVTIKSVNIDSSNCCLLFVCLTIISLNSGYKMQWTYWIFCVYEYTDTEYNRNILYAVKFTLLLIILWSVIFLVYFIIVYLMFIRVKQYLYILLLRTADGIIVLIARLWQQCGRIDSVSWCQVSTSADVRCKTADCSRGTVTIADCKLQFKNFSLKHDGDQCTSDSVMAYCVSELRCADVW